MPETFDGDYIDRLNRTYKGGKFVKTVVLWENYNPLTIKYWADHPESITFGGNVYESLHMFWGGIKTSQSMPTEGFEVSVSNLGNHAMKYVKEMDITGNEIIVELLHIDLLSTLTNYWKRKHKVLSVQADVGTAIFTVGRQLGRGRLPRKIILRDEFPAIDSSVPRIF